MGKGREADGLRLEGACMFDFDFGELERELGSEEEPPGLVEGAMGGNIENPAEKEPEREGRGGPGLCCWAEKEAEEEGLGPESPDSEVLETLLRGGAGPRGP